MSTAAGRTRRAQSGGFTMVELLIALTIMLIGITGIMAMYTSSIRATSYSRHATEAMILGEDKLEEFTAISYDQLLLLAAGCVFDPLEDPPGDPCEEVNAQGLVNPGDDSFTYGRSWVVEEVPSAADPDLRTVRVFVSWQERADRPQLEFVTQRTR
jgi:prepilin-type N-terminal cleavage/methylation domain-containing protein